MPKNLSKQRKNEKQRKSVCPLHFTDFKWPVFCSQRSKMACPVPNDIGDRLRTHRTTYHTYMSLVTYAQKPLKTPKNTEKPIFTKKKTEVQLPTVQRAYIPKWDPLDHTLSPLIFDMRPNPLRVIRHTWLPQASQKPRATDTLRRSQSSKQWKKVWFFAKIVYTPRFAP